MTSEENHTARQKKLTPTMNKGNESIEIINFSGKINSTIMKLKRTRQINELFCILSPNSIESLYGWSDWRLGIDVRKEIDRWRFHGVWHWNTFKITELLWMRLKRHCWKMKVTAFLCNHFFVNLEFLHLNRNHCDLIMQLVWELWGSIHQLEWINLYLKLNKIFIKNSNKTLFQYFRSYRNFQNLWISQNYLRTHWKSFLRTQWQFWFAFFLMNMRYFLKKIMQHFEGWELDMGFDYSKFLKSFGNEVFDAPCDISLLTNRNILGWFLIEVRICNMRKVSKSGVQNPIPK